MRSVSPRRDPERFGDVVEVGDHLLLGQSRVALVVCLDADCLPAPNLLAPLVAAATRPGAGLVAWAAEGDALALGA